MEAIRMKHVPPFPERLGDGPQIVYRFLEPRLVSLEVFQAIISHQAQSIT